MNELIFFGHVILVVAFILGALRLGREFLFTCFAIQIVLANLLIFKQITFFGLTMTCTEMLTIGSILTLNLIQEYYSKKEASKAIWVSFFMLVFFAFMTQIHLIYHPSPHDRAHDAYQAILSSGPRVVFASLFVTLFIQRLDMHLYSYLQKKLSPKRIVLRTFGSLVISQFLDTILFSFVGLFGLVHNIFHIICMSFFIKVIVISSMTPFTAFSKKIIGKHDPLSI
ncbi:MAG: queuosine precursor transporter [Simkaniaceae bacterium]